MRRLVDGSVDQKRERREEHHDGHEAERDALDQIDAEVGPDLELHERQRREAEQRGGGACGDGG